MFKQFKDSLRGKYSDVIKTDRLCICLKITSKLIAMAEHRVKILKIREVTPDVSEYQTEKPKNYKFKPGQATDISVVLDGWENEKRPFSFTGLPTDPYLKFTIKSYPAHQGVTKQIGAFAEGDEFIIDEPWGTIEYKGEGVFIAGGAGVTPFLAIFRDLNNKGKLGHNQLIFANKTEDDIIEFDELKSLLGDRLHNVISSQKDTQYDLGKIDEAYLKKKIKDFNQHFYVCGPEGFMKSVMKDLENLGAKADALVFEK